MVLCLGGKLSVEAKTGLVFNAVHLDMLMWESFGTLFWSQLDVPIKGTTVFRTSCVLFVSLLMHCRAGSYYRKHVQKTF